MKGLLVKDLLLLKMQKNFFILVFVICAFMAFSDSDSMFPITFLTFVLSLFSISTISYDEFENGNPFLFSLPISRRLYVIEKYCFALILVTAAALLAGLLCTVAGLVKESPSFYNNLFLGLTASLPSILILQALIIPFQLKFGAERGRIAIIAVIGTFFVVGTLLVRIHLFTDYLMMMYNSISQLSMIVFSGLFFTAGVLLFLASAVVSMHIMARKEF